MKAISLRLLYAFIAGVMIAIGLDTIFLMQKWFGIVLIIAGLALFIVARYKPEWFDKTIGDMLERL